ncbi:hypothetical protein DY000_02006268 [Brassica cretica]|uniref:Uncharacterized protein n=1 Tax=Brassica cretica TaxID=69181 RepID=A0ABQ7C5S6_BRACR|nr:hypothetical protein DY000_02006268 [Brassica cretica]
MIDTFLQKTGVPPTRPIISLSQFLRLEPPPSSSTRLSDASRHCERATVAPISPSPSPSWVRSVNRRPASGLGWCSPPLQLEDSPCRESSGAGLSSDCPVSSQPLLAGSCAAPHGHRKTLTVQLILVVEVEALRFLGVSGFHFSPRGGSKARECVVLSFVGSWLRPCPSSDLEGSPSAGLYLLLRNDKLFRQAAESASSECCAFSSPSLRSSPVNPVSAVFSLGLLKFVSLLLVLFAHA